MGNQREQIKAKRNEALAPQVVRALERRNFEAYFCPTGAEAVEKILELLPKDASVSWGGSITLQELGLPQRLHETRDKVLDRDQTNSPEERMEAMRQALLCDYYLTSVNAISEDGVLFNLDGVGNRVAAMVFGPKHVIVVAGMNKVVKSREDAYRRTRYYAAPINAKRVGLEQTPCAVTGSCGDCTRTDSICTSLLEQRLSRPKGRIKVILVGEELGY